MAPKTVRQAWERSTRRYILLLAMPALLAACTTEPPAVLAHQTAPARFIPEVARASAIDRAMAEIALTRSQNADVHGFANHVLADTRTQDAQLESLAKVDGIPFAAELSPLDRGDIEDLRGIRRDRFDMEYADFASRHGQQAVRLYDLAAQHSASPPVVEYAQATEPAIVRRFEAADRLFNAVRTDSYAIIFDSK
jgi:predicted outer membrane protein